MPIVPELTRPHILVRICQWPNIYFRRNCLVQTGLFVPMVMRMQNRPVAAGTCLLSSMLACDVCFPFVPTGIATMIYELANNGYFKVWRSE